ADLTIDPRVRARYLLDAADLLVTGEAEDRLGTREARRARAATPLERALDAEPDPIPLAGRLATLLLQPPSGRAQRPTRDPEAVEALEAVATISHEVTPRLTALFALASIYEKVLSRPDETERVLRQAITFDPQNPRALRALLRFLSSSPAPADGAAPKPENA